MPLSRSLRLAAASALLLAPATLAAIAPTASAAAPKATVTGVLTGMPDDNCSVTVASVAHPSKYKASGYVDESYDDDTGEPTGDGTFTVDSNTTKLPAAETYQASVTCDGYFPMNAGAPFQFSGTTYDLGTIPFAANKQVPLKITGTIAGLPRPTSECAPDAVTDLASAGYEGGPALKKSGAFSLKNDLPTYTGEDAPALDQKFHLAVACQASATQWVTQTDSGYALTSDFTRAMVLVLTSDAPQLNLGVLQSDPKVAHFEGTLTVKGTPRVGSTLTMSLPKLVNIPRSAKTLVEWFPCDEQCSGHRGLTFVVPPAAAKYDAITRAIIETSWKQYGKTVYLSLSKYIHIKK